MQTPEWGPAASRVRTLAHFLTLAKRVILNAVNFVCIARRQSLSN
jgi:hypothetical protein